MSRLASPADGHIRSIEGLRGLAVLMVMLYHFGTSCGFGGDSAVSRKLISVFCNLWSGVDVFFTLSGFLITAILLRVKGRPGYFRTFYLRRSLRIMPLYYLAMLIIFGVLPLLDLPVLDNPGIQRVRDAQAWMWLYAQDFAITFYNEDFFDPDPLWVGHFWSLGVEEHYYLFWPAIVHLCSARGLYRACYVMIALSLCVRFYMLAVPMDVSATYTFTLSRLDQLAIGGLLALLLRDCDHDTVRRWARWGLAASSAYIVGSIIHMRLYFYWTTTEALGFGFTALAIGSASLIVFAIEPTRNPIKAVLEARSLQTLGKYSYAAYVLHTPLQCTLQWLFPPAAIGELARPWGHTATQVVGLLGFVSAAVLTTTLLAAFVHHAFERPVSRLKRYFDYDDARAASAPAAQA